MMAVRYFELLLEMLLAKADVAIAAYYEHRLVDEPALKALGKQLRTGPKTKRAADLKLPSGEALPAALATEVAVY